MSNFFNTTTQKPQPAISFKRPSDDGYRDPFKAPKANGDSEFHPIDNISIAGDFTPTSESFDLINNKHGRSIRTNGNNTPVFMPFDSLSISSYLDINTSQGYKNGSKSNPTKDSTPSTTPVLSSNLHSRFFPSPTSERIKGTSNYNDQITHLNLASSANTPLESKFPDKFMFDYNYGKSSNYALKNKSADSFDLSLAKDGGLLSIYDELKAGTWEDEKKQEEKKFNEYKSAFDRPTMFDAPGAFSTDDRVFDKYSQNSLFEPAGLAQPIDAFEPFDAENGFEKSFRPQMRLSQPQPSVIPSQPPMMAQVPFTQQQPPQQPQLGQQPQVGQQQPLVQQPFRGLLGPPPLSNHGQPQSQQPLGRQLQMAFMPQIGPPLLQQQPHLAQHLHQQRPSMQQNSSIPTSFQRPLPHQNHLGVPPETQAHTQPVSHESVSRHNQAGEKDDAALRPTLTKNSSLSCGESGSKSSVSIGSINSVNVETEDNAQEDTATDNKDNSGIHLSAIAKEFANTDTSDIPPTPLASLLKVRSTNLDDYPDSASPAAEDSETPVSLVGFNLAETPVPETSHNAIDKITKHPSTYPEGFSSTFYKRSHNNFMFVREIQTKSTIVRVKTLSTIEFRLSLPIIPLFEMNPLEETGKKKKYKSYPVQINLNDLEGKIGGLRVSKQQAILLASNRGENGLKSFNDSKGRNSKKGANAYYYKKGYVNHMSK